MISAPCLFGPAVFAYTRRGVVGAKANHHPLSEAGRPSPPGSFPSPGLLYEDTRSAGIRLQAPFKPPRKKSLRCTTTGCLSQQEFARKQSRTTQQHVLHRLCVCVCACSVAQMPKEHHSSPIPQKHVPQHLKRVVFTDTASFPKRTPPSRSSQPSGNALHQRQQPRYHLSSSADFPNPSVAT